MDAKGKLFEAVDEAEVTGAIARAFGRHLEDVVRSDCAVVGA